MSSAKKSSSERRILRDPTRLIEADERIDSSAYSAEYPPLSAERGEYVDTHPVDDTPAAVRVGATIDGYRIRRQVGRGGMGVVYEAEQISLGRTVALKVMPPGALRNARAMERFRAEASAVARLSHPRIVAVHGFAVSDGIAYLAMEYVEGLDLAEIIDRLKTARTHGRRFVRISGPDLDKDITEWAQGRRLIGTMPGDPRIREGIVVDLRNPFPMAAAIVADAADALRHAHAHGVVHRDIKPSNLILSSQGRIKLSDFGLAKSVDAGSLTETGDFVGSPAYVSPEQATTRRVRIDERSDIYSLGVTLYELLTLHQPFVGQNVAVILRQILTKDPPPPKKVNPRIPRDLETIVLRAIEKDPDKRYQSAEELGDDLRRFLNFEPITARPLGHIAKAWRFVRAHRVTVALSSMGVAILALLLLLAGGFVDGRRATSDVAGQVLERVISNGRGDYRSLGILELVRELTSDATPAERRAGIERAAAEERRRLEAGEYDGRFEDLARMLTQLDARADFGSWSELESLLLQANIRGVKIELIRRMRNALASGSVAPRIRQLWLEELENLLDDGDWQVTKNAAVALGRLGARESVGALLKALRRRKDVEGRVAIIDALRVLDDPVAADLLGEELRSGDAWVRSAALDALHSLAPPNLLALVAPLEGDREAWLRRRFREVVAEGRADGEP